MNYALKNILPITYILYLLIVKLYAKNSNPVICKSHEIIHFKDFEKANCISSYAGEGKWTFLNTTEKASFDSCSNTSIITNLDEKHVSIYTGHTFESACYTPKACSILSLKLSYEIIKSFLDNKSFLFIGDSTSGQKYTAAQCASTRYFGQHNYIDFEHSSDRTLASNLMCDSSRCTNSSLIESHRLYRVPCTFCLECNNDGTKKEVTISPSFTQLDNRKIGIVILSTGAWYHSCKGIKTELRVIELRLTLKRIKGTLKQFIDDGGIVVWSQNPIEIFPEYSIHSVVYEELFPIGVLIVDYYDSVSNRIIIDRNVSIDGHTHFVNPGKNTLVEFMLQLIMQIISLRILNK
jgi:hypothetical protein